MGCCVFLRPLSNSAKILPELELRENLVITFTFQIQNPFAEILKKIAPCLNSNKVIRDFNHFIWFISGIVVVLFDSCPCLVFSNLDNHMTKEILLQESTCLWRYTLGDDDRFERQLRVRPPFSQNYPVWYRLVIASQ